MRISDWSSDVCSSDLLGFRANAFAPKPEKLNPLSGIKRIFGIQGLIELVKSLAKVALLGGIGFWVVWDRLKAIVQMGETGIRQIGRASCRERVCQYV